MEEVQFAIPSIVAEVVLLCHYGRKWLTLKNLGIISGNLCEIIGLTKNSKITVHRPTQKGTPSESHYHKYKNYDYFYDVWSNIHYGYVGLSVGFSEQALLSGSWVQQAGSDIISAFKERRLPRADTLDDNTAMKIGFELYKKRGKFAGKLTPEDILYILDNTPQNQLPNSKQIHWCNNPSNPNRIKK